MKISRRRFLSALAVAPAVIGLYTWRAEPTWTDYVRRTLPVKGLPVGLAGKRLVQLSDLHVGAQVDDAYLAKVFAEVARMEPDIVAYTGDFVTHKGPGSIGQLQRLVPKFPRGSLGTVAVLGNHDYGHRWSQPAVAAQVVDALRAIGCVVLRNEVVQVGGLAIGGVDDLWAGRLDLALTMAAKNFPHLVLCHNPDACDLAGWGDYRGWVLAGHTHGGQCKPPFLPPPLLPVKNRRYTAGAFELSGGRRLYINRGLGHLLRVRFNVRPEVTVFQLEREA